VTALLSQTDDDLAHSWSLSPSLWFPCVQKRGLSPFDCEVPQCKAWATQSVTSLCCGRNYYCSHHALAYTLHALAVDSSYEHVCLLYCGGDVMFIPCHHHHLTAEYIYCLCCLSIQTTWYMASIPPLVDGYRFTIVLLVLEQTKGTDAYIVFCFFFPGWSKWKGRAGKVWGDWKQPPKRGKYCISYQLLMEWWSKKKPVSIDWGSYPLYR